MIVKSRYNVLIVGAGHSGAQAAIALRQRKFEGTIAMIGEEVYIPYERPPLSKDYLAGEKSFERILIRPATFWEDRNIEMLIGKRIVSINAPAHTASTEDGETIGYGQLIWVAGRHPRRLSCSGHDLPGVHAVRTRDDIDRMIEELETVRKVAVIGGGYIGLEAAAVLTELGKQVVVLEALDRVLARVRASRFRDSTRHSIALTAWRSG